MTLTRDQQIILEASALRIDWGLKLYSLTGELLADRSDILNREGSRISRDSTNMVQGTGQLVLSEPLPWTSTLANPYVTLTDQWTGLSNTWNMGLWVMRTPATDLDPATPWTVDILDVVDMLSVPMGQTWEVDTEDNIGDLVEEIVDLHMSGLPTALPPIPWELAAPAMWFVVENATWLEAANELLSAAAYAWLYANANGALRTYVWQPLDSIEPTWTFDQNNPRNLIRLDSVFEAPPINTPNRWIGIRDDLTALPTEGNGQFTLTNQSDGPTSIDAINRTITRVEVIQAVDQNSLEAQIQHLAQSDRQRVGKIELRTGILPILWHADAVMVNLPEMGLLNIKGVATGWEIDMSDPIQRVTVEVPL